ncbi:MAG: hypothetical protein HPY50_14060 [Firmicutes bacterium]|nr:hypothetical protein [Bacillota bacterium]
MIDYLLSFFKPVARENHGQIILRIRGMTFRAHTWEAINKQVQSALDYYREKLAEDKKDTLLMLPGGNISGKWNVGFLMLGNTLKNVIALESFLQKHNAKIVS